MSREITVDVDQETLDVIVTVDTSPIGPQGIPGVSDHNEFSDLQGGQEGQYYHLTAVEYAALQALLGS